MEFWGYDRMQPIYGVHPHNHPTFRRIGAGRAL